MSEYLYAIMRNDLPSMNAGKLAAQTMHVGHAFSHEIEKSNIIRHIFYSHFLNWKKQTDYGFGKTIVLSASKEEIIELYKSLPPDLFFNLVYDPTYPSLIDYDLGDYLLKDNPDYFSQKIVLYEEKNKSVFLRHELVGMYVFCVNNENENLFKNFKLY